MPDRMLEDMPDIMPDKTSDRMPEDLPDKVPYGCRKICQIEC